MLKNLKGMLNKSASEKGELSDRDKEISAFDKISDNWNLENIQEYVRGQNSSYPLTDIGMASILGRFNNRRKDDAKFASGQRREFETTDRVERTKKGLDVVISIATQSSLSSETIPLLVQFIEVYVDVIQDLDKKLSQTYEHKIKNAYKTAEMNALAKSQFKKKLDIKYNT